MIFLSLRVIADAEGGLKVAAQMRRYLQGFGGGQPPTSTRRVYTGALLATMVKVPTGREISALFSGHYLSYNGREPD